MENTIPLPPLVYRTLVCGPGSEAGFESVGRQLVGMLKGHKMLGDGIDFLDVGCGCGRLARFLKDEPLRSYEGFDRHPEMVAWCNQVLAPLDSRFRFQHVDVKSAYVHWDGHLGGVDAGAFVFPYQSNAFDAILLASVFTHMPLNEVGNYLGELRRVLRPTGKILLSVFFSAGPAHTKDELNFFLEVDQFLAAVASAHFAARATRPAPVFGYEHNWYVLTPAPALGS